MIIKNKIENRKKKQINRIPVVRASHEATDKHFEAKVNRPFGWIYQFQRDSHMEWRESKKKNEQRDDEGNGIIIEHIHTKAKDNDREPCVSRTYPVEMSYIFMWLHKIFRIKSSNKTQLISHSTSTHTHTHMWDHSPFVAIISHIFLM